MQTVRKLRKRSGFTLVELLIVIIIIGILAGAMLLVAGSGTDKAEATKIISDLRALKAASLMYYADYGGDTVPEIYHGTSPDLAQYMDKNLDSTKYLILEPSGTKNWYVGYPETSTSGIGTALARNSKASGLLGGNASSVTSSDYGDGATHTHVWMRAR